MRISHGIIIITFNIHAQLWKIIKIKYFSNDDDDDNNNNNNNNTSLLLIIKIIASV